MPRWSCHHFEKIYKWLAGERIHPSAIAKPMVCTLFIAFRASALFILHVHVHINSTDITQHYSVIVVESIVVIKHDCASLDPQPVLPCPPARSEGALLLTRKEYEAGIFCLQNEHQILLQIPMHVYMQLMASVVTYFTNSMSKLCLGSMCGESN